MNNESGEPRGCAKVLGIIILIAMALYYWLGISGPFLVVMIPLMLFALVATLSGTE